MKPFGFGAIFDFKAELFFVSHKICSGSLKPSNQARNYNQTSDLDLIVRMSILTVCSLLFGAYLAYPHSVSSLDEDDTSFYRNICDEV